jgi:hypothetical protein
MGNRRSYKIERLHTLGTADSELLKVTALNLLHPTASPPFQKFGFFLLRHGLLKGGRSVRLATEVRVGVRKRDHVTMGW